MFWREACDDFKAPAGLVEMRILDNVGVVFGPGCSIGAFTMSTTLQYYLLQYLPYNVNVHA